MEEREPMRTGFVGVAIITAAVLAFTACSNGGTTAGPGITTGEATTTPTARGTTSEPTSAPPADAATRVEVTENEFTIVLPGTDFSPGTYTFAVDNQGRDPHDRWIKGPGVDNVKTETLDSGGQGEVTVTHQPGIVTG
jgi:hypothetical protein